MKLVVATLLYISFAHCFSLDDKSPLPLIIGGKNATRRDFPYMVSLQVFGWHNCGGAILSPTWVITAAHCFSSPAYLVAVVGMLNLQEKHLDIQRVPAIDLIEHSGSGDVALVKLAYEFIFDEAVQPIRLPKINEEFSGTATVSGWGLTNFSPKEYPVSLQYLQMPIISNQECCEYVHGDPECSMSDTILCALPERLGESGCNGDSGGPLVQSGKNGKILIGTVQGGEAECGQGSNKTTLNLFMKVSRFIDFITANVDDLP